MQRFNSLSAFEKFIVALCICGLLVSMTAFIWLKRDQDQTKWLTVDEYISTVEVEQERDSASQGSEQSDEPSEKSLEDPLVEYVTNQQSVSSADDNSVVGEKLININTATYDQLLQLKGIGPTKAKAIIEERELGGPFKSVEDIMRVKGIGSKTYESIKESLVN